MADSITGRMIFNVFKISLLVMGLSLFSVAWLLNKDNLARDQWPTTKGKIFYSQVVERQKELFGRQIKWYDLDVKYGYVVDKVRYDKKGLFLEPADKNLKLKFFKQQAKEFKKGKIVKVHYNPANPKQAYLLTNVDEGTRSFYRVSRDIVLFTLFLFLISPVINLFKDKKYKEKNKVESGLVVPDDAKRVEPFGQPLSKDR